MIHPQESPIAAQDNQANSIYRLDSVLNKSLAQTTSEREIRQRLQCANPRCECHRQTGKVHCPCHDDQRPSLSINTKNGKVLFKCHIGCPQSDLVAALFSTRYKYTTGNSNGNQQTQKSFPWNNATAIYQYTDEEGEVLFEVGRDGHGNEKAIRQRRPDGNGGYIYNLGDARRVLYRLPEVQAANTVLLVEGEKAADFINAEIEANPFDVESDVVATTSPHGAGKWKPEYSESLRDKDVFIFPDNDKPGRDHATKILKSLHGIARSVRIVNLPDQPEKAGADDWLEANDGDITKLFKIAHATEPNQPKGALQIVRKPPISEVKKPPTTFTGYPIYPRRQVTLFSGHGASGKSYLSLVIAAHLAAGVNWGNIEITQGKVLFVSLEDEPNIVIWRMVNIISAYGLDVNAVWENLDIAHTPDIFEPLMRESSGEKGLEKTIAWQSLKQQMHGYDTVIIDNASDAFIANINDNALVREFIRELQVLAQVNNSAVVLLAHIDKAGARNGTQGDSYTGTTAWHNTVRSRLALVNNDGALQLVHEKANLSKAAEPVFIERDELNHGVPIIADLQAIADAKTEATNASAIAYAPEVLKTIEKVIKRGDCHITTNRGNGVTTFTLLKKNQLSAPPGGQKVFWAALDHLLDTGEIETATYQNSGRALRTEIIIPENAISKVAGKGVEIA
jgi:hypothetical protein